MRTLLGSVLTLSFLGITLASPTNSKCYVLAFSSGDQSAAYQAGAFDALTSTLKPEDVLYSSISVVSGSSVNGALLSSVPLG